MSLPLKKKGLSHFLPHHAIFPKVFLLSLFLQPVEHRYAKLNFSWGCSTTAVRPVTSYLSMYVFGIIIKKVKDVSWPWPSFSKCLKLGQLNIYKQIWNRDQLPGWSCSNLRNKSHPGANIYWQIELNCYWWNETAFFSVINKRYTIFVRILTRAKRDWKG